MSAASIENRDHNQLRILVESALERLGHVLPGQGPIMNFIHHNTLHGYQHLPFEEALEESDALTGISGYQSEIQFREYYRQGRITDADLIEALSQHKKIQDDDFALVTGDRKISRLDLYRVAMLHDLKPLSAQQLSWNIQERNALQTLQEDVAGNVRRHWLANGDHRSVEKLWSSIVAKLNLDDSALRPEFLSDFPVDLAEDWLSMTLSADEREQPQSLHETMQIRILSDFNELLERIGSSISLAGFLSVLCGTDVFELYRPQLQRIIASALDEGISPWPLPGRERLGLYKAWRASLQFDANPYLHELPEWPIIRKQLQDNAVDTIVSHMTHLSIPVERWSGYLQRLALELPGWSGYVNWRQQNPEYGAPVMLADYLAIRLTLDRVWLGQICQETWKIEANLVSLASYFRKNLSEFHVRWQLFLGVLPEYLSEQAQELIEHAGSERTQRHQWQRLSDRISTWKSSPMNERNAAQSLNDQGWRLFVLSQHLAVFAEHIDAMDKVDLIHLLAEVDEFGPSERLPLWLYAYEKNYRDRLFQGLQAKRDRGNREHRRIRPGAQIVCCMDEREESFRRHLEELDATIETLGAAGFFGVPMKYKGLDDYDLTPLCPVVVRPTHRVDEIVRPSDSGNSAAHRRGHKFFKMLNGSIHHGLRRNLLLAHIEMDLWAPFTALGLLGELLFPGLKRFLAKRFQRTIERPVATELAFTATQTDGLSDLQIGFTDLEQADRIEGLLKTMGLTEGFAPYFLMMAHGSTSLNNPHEAAHDCGACGGRRGGPNARVFAAMANRFEVRSLLARRGISIPSDTWFIGAQHDTCSDEIIWYDTGALPESFKPGFIRLRDIISQAQRLSAQERCRRFVSMDDTQSLDRAFHHVHIRASDTSQVRPEYGHATNASAIIGRRAITQGLFLDRRAFLISYDARQDPDGAILESILLTAGPVGAGINLEYYFSTVNNDRFGCGTKIPHNITGLFGVMEGTGSDLRTGLPLQMVEIHEAMRLQIVVEASTSVLTDIYHRQSSLRELIAGGWVHLTSMDPGTGDLSIFVRGKGFLPWSGPDGTVQIFDSSQEYYQRQNAALAPVLIQQPETPEQGGRHG